jgi:hypothetical protein
LRISSPLHARLRCGRHQRIGTSIGAADVSQGTARIYWPPGRRTRLGSGRIVNPEVESSVPECYSVCGNWRPSALLVVEFELQDLNLAPPQPDCLPYIRASSYVALVCAENVCSQCYKVEELSGRYGGRSVTKTLRQVVRGLAFVRYFSMASPTSRCSGYNCEPPCLECVTTNVSARQSMSSRRIRRTSPLRNP